MMTTPRRLRAALPCLALLLVLGPPLAWAQDRGYIDGSQFIDLADENKELVQVSVGGALLRALSGFIPDNKEAAEAVANLTQVEAYIVGVRDDAAEAAKSRVLGLERSLMADGWQRLARLREAGSHVIVLIDERDEVVHGLVVMVYEPDEPKVVFTNIVGKIDLATIASLGDTLKVPGLEHVEE